MSLGAKLAFPNFGNDRPEGATDFNDVAVLCGADLVKSAIEAAIETQTRTTGSRGES
jgi:putative DNA primase/helicase